MNGWRGETDTLEKMVQRVAHDIEYIRRFGLLFDVQIIVRTVFGSQTRQNAYQGSAAFDAHSRETQADLSRARAALDDDRRLG